MRLQAIRINLSKLSIQLGLLLTGVLSVTLFVSLSILSKIEESRAIEELNTDSEYLLQITRDNVKRIYQQRDQNDLQLQQFSRSVGKLPGVKWLEVFDTQGKIIAHTLTERIGMRPLTAHQSIVTQVLTSGNTAVEIDRKQQQYNLFSPYHALEDQKKVAGVIELSMGLSDNIHDQIVTAQSLMILIHETLEQIELNRASLNEQMQTAFTSIGRLDSVKKIEMFDEQATIIAHTDANKVGQKPQKYKISDHEQVVKDVFTSGVRYSEFDYANNRYNIFVPIRLNENSTSDKPVTVVELTMNLGDVTDAIARHLRPLYLIAVLSILLMGTLLHLTLTKFVIRPIKLISGFLTQTGKGDFVGKIEKFQLNNEIQELGDSFNNMTKQLREAREIETSLNAMIAQKSKMAALGEISAGIAHEINNPLTIINGATAQLLKVREDPEKFQTKVASIQRSCDRISKIVTNMRKSSRVSQASDKRSHSLSGVIKESIGFCDLKSLRCGTPIFYDLETTAAVLCDDVSIGQVIVNLINNAIDAVKTLDEKWVRLRLFEDPEGVVLQVRDSGMGIAPEVAAKLFQPFFTTKPVGEGTGLGLSIIKGILDDHEATISILSDEPNTCFEVRFKKAQSLSQAA